MILKRPFGISARLLPCLEVEGAYIQLEYASPSEDEEGRTVYKWTVDLPGVEGPDDGGFSGEDLKSGCQGGDLQEGFESLLGFLSAAGRSRLWEQCHGTPGQNSDLFPEQVEQWASENQDELDLLYVEIQESNERLVEE